MQTLDKTTESQFTNINSTYQIDDIHITEFWNELITLVIDMQNLSKDEIRRNFAQLNHAKGVIKRALPEKK